MVGVFTLHLAGTYMAHAPAWWFVTSPDGSLVFTVLALVLDTTVMPLLFVLGGYTAAASLDRHRWRDFARRRLTRVGLPWVLGVVVLAPPTTWLWPYARGVTVDPLAFLGLFWAGPAFSQSVYWFLGVLLAFNLLTPAFRLLPPASLVPLSVAGSLALAQHYPLDHWLSGPLTLQPARAAVLAACYAAGVLVHDRGGAPRASRVVLATMALAAQLGHVGARHLVDHGAPGSTTLLALAFSAAAWTTVALLSNEAPRWLSSPSPLARAFARHGYGIYLLHPLVLLPLALAARHLPLPALPRGLLTGALALALTWAASALLHHHARPWRAVLG